MAQNVADHLRVGADVNLSGRVTVAKHMRTKYGHIDSGLASIVTDTMADAAAG